MKKANSWGWLALKWRMCSDPWAQGFDEWHRPMLKTGLFDEQLWEYYDSQEKYVWYTSVTC